MVNPPTDRANPIDAFIGKTLQTQALKVQPRTTPEIWLRRATLDLTGLVPTADESKRFAEEAAKSGALAYRNAVDRLLASPHHGERMALDWLDISRYADTHGFNNDSARSMWRWRDWVIEAFNRNVPYDLFITEQIAGDMLPNPTLEQHLATGFSRNHVINSEGGIIDEEYRLEYVADRVRTLGTAWLGLTVECARCHDHKYDPISQRDYYRLFANFNSIAEFGEDGRIANAAPLIPAPTLEQRIELQRLTNQIWQLNSLVLRKNGVRDHSNLQGELNRSNHFRLGAIAGAVLGSSNTVSIHCNEPKSDDPRLKWKSPERPNMTDGVLGTGWLFSQHPAALEIDPKAMPLGKKSGGAFMIWINPNSRESIEAQDQILYSTMNYSVAPASGEFGNGQEVRLVGNEVEVRLCRRWPAYSTWIRTREARVIPNHWTHISVFHDGSLKPSGIRVFINGKETDIEWRGEGLTDNVAERAGSIGFDPPPMNGTYFQGKMDELHFINFPITPDQIRAIYELERPSNHPSVQPKNAVILNLQKKVWELEDQLHEFKKQLPTTMVLQEMPSPRKTFVLSRGRYDVPADEVQPGAFETLLNAWPQDAPRNRLGLAQWLVSPRNPLVSRVVVNRLWAQFFGTGLVKTVEDFGVRGDLPSHPELLDWLAIELVRCGWNLKHIIRLMVLSDAYARDSRATETDWQTDPENRFLARGPRVRLPAELIRDHALQLGEVLSLRIGGPSVFPTQPSHLYEGLVVGAAYPGTTWTNSSGGDAHRRSLYTFWKRTIPYPSFIAFDAPDREFCLARRTRTNTPMQALVSMNDPTFLQAAGYFAERGLEACSDNRIGNQTSHEDRTLLSWLFTSATGKPPTASEIESLRAYLERTRASFGNDIDGAKAWLYSTGGSTQSLSQVQIVQKASWYALAHLILNLDSTITNH